VDADVTVLGGLVVRQGSIQIPDISKRGYDEAAARNAQGRLGRRLGSWKPALDHI